MSGRPVVWALLGAVVGTQLHACDPVAVLGAAEQLLHPPTPDPPTCPPAPCPGDALTTTDPHPTEEPRP